MKKKNDQSNKSKEKSDQKENTNIEKREESIKAKNKINLNFDNIKILVKDSYYNQLTVFKSILNSLILVYASKKDSFLNLNFYDLIKFVKLIQLYFLIIQE